MIHTVFRRLPALLVVLLACSSAPAIGQPPPGAAPPAPPPPEAPNPPPAAAAEVAEFYGKVIAAKPTDVDAIASKAADLPFCRLRLYVNASVGDRNIAGIDHGIFQKTGKIRPIVLSGTSNTFRARLNRLLSDPAAASSKNGESGVRIVDFWCQRSEQANTYVPLLAKVWSNAVAADIPPTDGTTPIPGRVCYDDRPAIAECQQAFDYDPQVFKNGMAEVGMPAGTVSSIAEALTAHRTEVAALIAKQAADRPATRRTPASLDRPPAEAVISFASTHALGEESSVRVNTAPRILAGGEAFIGLTPEAKEGTATLRMKLPFAIGGGVLRAPSRITSLKASIDVEVSKDGEDWTSIFLLDPGRGHSGSRWDAEPSYQLPSSLRGATKLQVRARLTSTDETAGLDRAAGPRFLDVVYRLPRTTEILVTNGLLRTVKCRDQLDAAQKPMELLVQPEKLDVQSLSDLIQAGEPEIGVDVHVPCDLDQAACSTIAKFPGAIRFRSPDEWQQHPPTWLSTMTAGPGKLEFAAIQEPTAALAAAVADGKKSLAFPAAEKPAADVLTALAACTTNLALDGIREMSAEQAAALNAYRGTGLSLRALRAVSITSSPGAPLAAALVASSGTLTVDGTTPPDAAALATIAAGEKHLVFEGLPSLDQQASTTLATCGTGLFLNAVTSLPRDAADPLSSYAGPLLSLPRLKRVECGLDALFPTDRRPPTRLPAAIRQAAMEAPSADGPAAALDKELESLLSEAMEKGLLIEAEKQALLQEAKSSSASLGKIVERVREVLPLLPSGARLELRAGTPLAAFVEAPGVFVLQPTAARIAAKPPTDRAVFETMARGRKHLDLSGLASLDDAAAAALATTANILSLDGLTSLSPEAARALSSYKGTFLSLNGLSVTDEEAKSLLPLFEPLVREDRASLATLGMIHVGGLRAFAGDKGDTLPEKQKRAAKQFFSNSGTKDWTGLAPGQRLKGKVAALLGTEVIFETAVGLSNKVPGTGLSPTSVKAIKGLAELGKELASARTKAMLEDAADLGNGPSAADATDAKP